MPSPRRNAALLSLALTATVATSAAHATITPDARRIVERYVAAIGGREAVLGARSLYARGSLSAFGLSGSARIWHQRPDHRASELELGPLKLSDGYDGKTAWRTDPSGRLVILDGLDLQDAVSQAWLENDRWLEPDQAGGTVTTAGSERDSLGTYAVLEVTPPGPPGGGAARSQRMWFDERTGLLVRTVSKKDQHTVIHVSSDYRPVGVRKLAFQSLTRIEGMPANDIRLTLDSVAVNPEIPAARFAPPAAEGSAVRWLKTPGRARLPFEYASRHIWLRASVNGAPPADFLYDTGASLTVLDSAYAARIGIRTEGRQQGVGAGATGDASFASVSLLRVAATDSDGVEVRDLKVAVLGLGPFLTPFFWREVAGVIGFDFIQRFVDEIDYDARTLVLYDPKGFRYQGNGASIPMTLAGTVPVVTMKLDGGLEGQFRLDVGSGSTVDLHAPFVKQHGLLEAAGDKLDVAGGGFGGTFRTTVRRMRRLEIGPYGWDAPLVGLSQATRGAFTSEDYAGNIGNQILQRFKCTLDYERRVVHLEPGRRFGEPDVFPRTGVQLARFGERVEAFAVLPNSPAAEAGLREGDEVVSIDGRPAREWTAEEVAETLERGRVGTRHTLEISRDGKRVRTGLVLRDLL